MDKLLVINACSKRQTGARKVRYKTLDDDSHLTILTCHTLRPLKILQAAHIY